MKRNKTKIKSKKSATEWYQIYGKRMLDVLLSASAIVVLSPLLLIIGILVRIKLGKPVIFKQQRPGKDERIFTIYKFRTMTDKRNQNGELLPDEKRLTKFGLKLRSSSMDELPELFNVLKGDMSLVGPRPLLVQYLPHYSIQQRHRHDVRPGLTGLAQTKGRNSLSWDEKFQYDLKYIEKISFCNDFIIVIETIKTIWNQKGIHSDTSMTMEPFLGKKCKIHRKK